MFEREYDAAGWCWLVVLLDGVQDREVPVRGREKAAYPEAVVGRSGQAGRAGCRGVSGDGDGEELAEFSFDALPCLVVVGC